MSNNRDLSHVWGNLKSDRQGVRVINALRRAGCKQIEQALEMSDKTLLRISGVGPKGVKRLRQEQQFTTDIVKYTKVEWNKDMSSTPVGVWLVVSFGFDHWARAMIADNGRYKGRWINEDFDLIDLDDPIAWAYDLSPLVE